MISFKVKKKVYPWVHLFLLLSFSTFAQQPISMGSDFYKKYYSILLQETKGNNRNLIFDQPLSKSSADVYLSSTETFIKELLETQSINQKSLENAIAQLENIQSPTMIEKYFLNDLYLKNSLALAYTGNRISALLMFRTAYRLNSKLYEQYPDFLPIQKTNGLINCILGSIPEKYNWLLGIFGFSGDYEKGLNQLRTVGSTTDSIALEAKLLSLIIPQFIENNNVLEDLVKLQKKYPKSQTIRVFLNISALKSNRSRLIIENSNDNDLPVVLAQLAEAYLNNLNFEKSLHYYQKYEKLKGGNITATDAFKIWLGFHLSDQSNIGEKYRLKIINHPKLITDNDQYAYNEAVKNNLNKEITKIRLLIDGGFFSEANLRLDEANAKNTWDQKEMAELDYRWGRLFQLESKPQIAKPFFIKCVRKSIEPIPYFIPNAALNLGKIYLMEKKLDSATIYFEKCIEFDGYDYENSIEKTAKIYLQALKK